MPIQQTHSDINSTPQKLSKIETLRLARNYIAAMAQTLREGRPMDMARFTKILGRDLSQTTANLLAGTMMGGVNNINSRFGACRRFFADDHHRSSRPQNGPDHHQSFIYGTNYYGSYWPGCRYEYNTAYNNQREVRCWNNNGFNEHCLYSSNTY